jgi:predicted component of viral defense system (DUF524 family)
MNSLDEKFALLDVRDNYDCLITQIELYPSTPKDSIFWDQEARGALALGLPQIFESSTYEYRIADQEFQIRQLSGVISRRAFQGASRDQGTIRTGLFVGTLPLIVETPGGGLAGTARIEVRSRKLNYESEYRSMLGDIADWCTALINDFRGATANRFRPDPGKDWNTIQERFFILNAIIDSRHFLNALHRIQAFPDTLLETQQEDTDLRKGMKWTGSIARQFASESRRVGLSAKHPLRQNLGIESVPTHVRVNQRHETADTPANQFVKFALEAFEFFLTDMVLRLKRLTKNDREPYSSVGDGLLIENVEKARMKISEFLSHGLFQKISAIRSIPIGNPVLQRKAGYREVLQAWLKFQMASQLVWEGGNDVYFGGQKDVATLYEYWVFFNLLASFKSVAKVDNSCSESLFEETPDGLSIKLKAGRMLGPIRGKAKGRDRQFHMEFSYNKTFSHSTQWNTGASWTRRLRPDYTFEIWPISLEKAEAESKGALVRIHFDAKYRAHISDLFGEDSNEGAGLMGRKRSYLPEDLMKMHAYRDAIRRTEGAYVIFPGNEETVFYQFEELLPGLGAFALRPDLHDSGTFVIRNFLNGVIRHLSNRVAVSERISYAMTKVLSDGKLAPVYANLSDSMEIEGVSGVTPPANEVRVLLVQQLTKEIAEWTTRHNKIVLFLEAGPKPNSLIEEVVGSDIVAKRSPSEDGYEITEHIPRSFHFLTTEQLASTGFPEDPVAKSIVLVINLSSANKGFLNISHNLLNARFRNMTDETKAYSLAELLDLQGRTGSADPKMD